MIDIKLLHRLRNVGLDLIFLSYSKFSSLLTDDEYQILNETALEIDELFIEYIFYEYEEDDQRKIVDYLISEFHRLPEKRPELNYIIEEMERGESIVSALTMKYMDKYNKMNIQFDRDYNKRIDFAPVCSLIEERENVFNCCWCCPIRENDSSLSYVLGSYIVHITAVHFSNIEYEFWHSEAKTFEEYLSIYEKRKRFDKVVDYLVQVNDYLKVNGY